MYAQLGDGGLEVLQRVERPVHGREPQVGDEVQLLKRPQYGETDIVRTQLGVPCRPQRLFDALTEQGQGVLRDGATLARLTHSVDHLRTTEGLRDTAPLDHHQ
ncbi:putative transcriptional regulator NrdR [Streptomyces sp. Tu6071]|nr:putative transcriptional regulator NrdR [Streptomyces sp. Tu6071]